MVVCHNLGAHKISQSGFVWLGSWPIGNRNFRNKKKRKTKKNGKKKYLENEGGSAESSKRLAEYLIQLERYRLYFIPAI